MNTNCIHTLLIFRHSHLLFMGSVPRINCLLTISSLPKAFWTDLKVKKKSFFQSELGKFPNIQVTEYLKFIHKYG